MAGAGPVQLTAAMGSPSVVVPGRCARRIGAAHRPGRLLAPHKTRGSAQPQGLRGQRGACTFGPPRRPTERKEPPGGLPLRYPGLDVSALAALALYVWGGNLPRVGALLRLVARISGQGQRPRDWRKRVSAWFHHWIIADF